MWRKDGLIILSGLLVVQAELDHRCLCRQWLYARSPEDLGEWSCSGDAAELKTDLRLRGEMTAILDKRPNFATIRFY